VNVIGGCCVSIVWSPKTTGDFFPRLLAVGLINLGTFLTGDITLESVSCGFAELLQGEIEGYGDMAETARC